MKKILSGFLLSLVVMGWPVWAAETTKSTMDTQSSFYVVATNSPLKRSQTRYDASSCISFAKWYLGRSGEVWGNAGQIKPSVENPYVGGLVLTREGKFGHVAVITKIEDDTLSVIEANWIPNQISTRSLSSDSPVIRGYR